MQSVDKNGQKSDRERLRPGKRSVRAFAVLSVSAAVFLLSQQTALAEAPSLAPIQLAQAPPQFILLTPETEAQIQNSLMVPMRGSMPTLAMGGISSL
jgi:hypothetical protein